MTDTTFKWEGTVSEGTLRAEDLLHTFARVAKDMCPDAYKKWAEQPAGDDSQEYVVELMDMLDEHAPEGYFFGAHEGDPACFGFWKVEDDPTFP